MKHIHGLLLLLSLSLSITVSAHGKKHEEKVIMKGLHTPAAKVVMSFHKALRTGDKALARKLLADDVQIYEGGRVERSAEQYAHHHMLSDMKYLAAVSSKPLEHQVKVMGDSAVSMARNHTKGSYKGKERDYQGMETMVLEKQAGEWKIVHIHWSH